MSERLASREVCWDSGRPCEADDARTVDSGLYQGWIDLNWIEIDGIQGSDYDKSIQIGGASSVDDDAMMMHRQLIMHGPRRLSLLPMPAFTDPHRPHRPIHTIVQVNSARLIGRTGLPGCRGRWIMGGFGRRHIPSAPDAVATCDIRAVLLPTTIPLPPNRPGPARPS